MIKLITMKWNKCSFVMDVGSSEMENKNKIVKRDNDLSHLDFKSGVALIYFYGWLGPQDPRN